MRNPESETRDEQPNVSSGAAVLDKAPRDVQFFETPAQLIDLFSIPADAGFSEPTPCISSHQLDHDSTRSLTFHR